MSQTHGDGLRIGSYKASGDLSDCQYLLVDNESTAWDVKSHDDDDVVPVGVLQNKPEDGEAAEVMMLGGGGTSKLVAKGTVTLGDLIAPAAVATAADRGKVRTLPTASGTYYIVGRALETVADGEILEGALFPPIQRVVA